MANVTVPATVGVRRSLGGSGTFSKRGKALEYGEGAKVVAVVVVVVVASLFILIMYFSHRVFTTLLFRIPPLAVSGCTHDQKTPC